MKGGEEEVAVQLEVNDDEEKKKEKEEENVISQNNKKQHFVLVHGISHGAWCWYKIRTLMENSGNNYKVTCLDLKGAGLDLTDPDTVFTLDDYNKPLLDFISSLPDDEKVILVGHSAGGLNITDAAYKFPNKVSLVIYVAATMLKSGYLTEQDVKDGVPDLSDFGEFHEVFDISFALGQDQPPTGIVIKKELLRKINYQMCPQEDSTLAAMLVRPGPIRALTSAQFDEENNEKVPRIYIKTRYDRVCKLWQQEQMIKRWPPAKVYILDSDHSPFFSAPFVLVGLLVTAAASL